MLLLHYWMWIWVSILNPNYNTSTHLIYMSEQIFVPLGKPPVPTKWREYTLKQRRYRIQGNIYPLAWSLCRLHPRYIPEEDRTYIQVIPAHSHLNLPVEIEEYVYYEDDGWKHLACHIDDLPQLSAWQLARATNIAHPMRKKKWGQQRHNLLCISRQVMLQDLSAAPRALPFYITENLKKLAAKEPFPGIIWRGRIWREPTSIEDIYTYYQSFQNLKSMWYLPVPPLHSRQAYCSWYKERVDPSEKCYPTGKKPSESSPQKLLAWNRAKQSAATWSAIQKRDQQAKYASFLFCFKKFWPVEFSKIYSMTQMDIGKWYASFVKQNGQPKCSYSKINDFEKELALPYFNTQFNVFLFSEKETKMESFNFGVYAKIPAYQVVDEQHVELLDTVYLETLQSFKKIIGQKKEKQYNQELKCRLERSENCLQQTYNIKKERIRLFMVEKDFQAEDYDAELVQNAKSLPLDVIIKRQVETKKTEQRIANILAKDKAMKFQSLLQLEKQFEGVPSKTLEPSILAPEIVRIKKKHDRIYFGCPLCGKDVKSTNLHECRPCSKNRLSYNKVPRTTVSPFSIEFLRPTSGHGIALCLFCHETYSSRGLQCGCDERANYYRSTLKEDIQDVSGSMHGVSFRLRIMEDMPVPVDKVQVLHGQPQWQDMIISDTVTCHNCSPALEGRYIVETEKVHRLVRKIHGIVALDGLRKGTLIGFIGGNIFPIEFFDFMFRLNEPSNWLSTKFEGESPFCFGPIQYFTGLSFCSRMPSNVFSNAIIRFGLSEENHVKAYLQITDNILPDEEIIITSAQRFQPDMFTKIIMIGGCGMAIDEPTAEKRPRPRALEVKDEEVKDQDDDEEEEDPDEDSYHRRMRNLMSHK